MEQGDKVQSLGDYAAILRRRWRILAAIMPSAVLLSVFLAYALPAQYQSTATILLEPSSIPKELVQTTVISYADQQIELVQRTVMTVDRLLKVVEQIDPYPEMPEMTAREKARLIIDSTTLEKVDPITYKPLAESSAFSIHYLNPDPEIAAEVTELIAGLFLTYNRESRTAQAREAYTFLFGKSKELDSRIRELEQQLSDFKTRYGDALPEARARNEAALDRTMRDLDAIEAEMRVAEQQEALLALQLSQISPTIVSSGTDITTQLGQLRAELAAAQQKYTPDHPDVKRLNRAIEALAAQVRLGNTAVANPDNPEYLRVASELGAMRRNLAALRSTGARARTQLADYESRLNKSPVVERDYVQISRDRDIAEQQLEEIRVKLREAEIAQTLESEARGERYTLIRSPRVATSPASPNRLGLILLGFVLGGGLAVGLAAFKESSDPAVRSASDLADLGDLTLIGAIPHLRNQADRRHFKLIWGGVAGAYLIAIGVVAMTVFRAVQA